MVEHQDTTKSLLPLRHDIFDNATQPGVSARDLYGFLGLNQKVYARWARKNILTNPFAIEHVDWESTLPDVEYSANQRVAGNFAQDYALAIDFAKRLSMMARSAKGEEARQYFIACEKVAKESPRIPQVKNPIHQLLIDTVVRLDAVEQSAQQARDRAEQADAAAAQANANAVRALESQLFFTVAEYIYVNKLQGQLPPSGYRAASDHLRLYCMDNRIPFRKMPVGGQRWDEEYAFHVHVYTEVLHGWLTRRAAQTTLHILPATKKEGTP